MTEAPDTVANLERIRLAQERVWFAAGRSREWIIREFRGWPTQLGYPAYEWSVGYADGGVA